jgi:hypothetical protein
MGRARGGEAVHHDIAAEKCLSRGAEVEAGTKNAEAFFASLQHGPSSTQALHTTRRCLVSIDIIKAVRCEGW